MQTLFACCGSSYAPHLIREHLHYEAHPEVCRAPGACEANPDMEHKILKPKPRFLQPYNGNSYIKGAISWGYIGIMERKWKLLYYRSLYLKPRTSHLTVKNLTLLKHQLCRGTWFGKPRAHMKATTPRNPAIQTMCISSALRV